MKETEYICTHCGKKFKEPIEIYNKFSSSPPEKYKKTYGCPVCRYDGIEPVKTVTATKKELRQYIMLCRETEKESARLTALQSKGEDCTELFEMIENNRLRCMSLLLKTQQFIYSIDDSLTRQIFELRYIKGLRWAGVASGLGGYYTEDYVRITHDRYLKSICNDSE